MISATIFLLYTALLFVIPICEYRHPRWYTTLMRNMSYTVNGHKFLAYILALAVIFFHLVYFAAFPANRGLMISTIFVFFLLSTKRTIQVLRLTNEGLTMTLGLALASIIFAFIPLLFSSAVSIAFLLQVACVLPPSNDDDITGTEYVPQNEKSESSSEESHDDHNTQTNPLSNDNL